MLQITEQHTYTFQETGESVTAYVSNDENNFGIALSFSHKETADNLQWTPHYTEILQIQSQINPLIWFMYLTAYWYDSSQSIPTERVVMVCDCNWKHNK